MCEYYAFRYVSPVAMEGNPKKSNEAVEPSLRLEYKEYVIYRDPMDCYDHAVHLRWQFIYGQVRRDEGPYRKTQCGNRHSANCDGANHAVRAQSSSMLKAIFEKEKQ